MSHLPELEKVCCAVLIKLCEPVFLRKYISILDYLTGSGDGQDSMQRKPLTPILSTVSMPS